MEVENARTEDTRRKPADLSSLPGHPALGVGHPVVGGGHPGLAVHPGVGLGVGVGGGHPGLGGGHPGVGLSQGVQGNSLPMAGAQGTHVITRGRALVEQARTSQHPRVRELRH